MINRFLFIIVLSLLNSVSLYAQVDTKGTDFWLTFGKNWQRTYDSTNLQIRIAGGEQNAAVNLYFTGLNNTVSFFVAAGQVYTYNLNKIERQAVYNEIMGISNKSVHITSSEPVTVYALNQSYASTDATNVLPVAALGSDYYHLSYPCAYDDADLEEDAYAAVAMQNLTQIYRNDTLTATLNRGEVYYRTSGNDMTGTHITADKPIAFFALHQGPYIPVTCNGTWCYASDNLFQQLAPVNTWGKNFFVPVSWRGRDFVRIMVSQNYTNIKQTGATVRNVAGGQTKLTDLKAGQWVELEVSLANNGCYIQADKPVGVCAYLTSDNYNTPHYQSDPAEAWLPPVEQKISAALIAPFIPADSTKLNAHYALVITPTATQNKTTVKKGNGIEQPLSGGRWYNNTAAGMSFYSMPLTDSTSAYLFTNREGGLTVMGYGTGSFESYYYMAASGMRSLDAVFYVNNIHYVDLAYKTVCTPPSQFRAEISGDISTTAGHLKWYIDDDEEESARDRLTWSKNYAPGTHQIKMIVRMNDEVTTRTIEAVMTVASANDAIDVDNNLSICSSAVTLNVKNPVSGAAYNWYDNTGTILLDTGISFTTPVLNNSTRYIVKMEGVLCLPDPATVSITVTQPPQVTAMDDRRICYGDEITLKTLSKEGTISWNVPKTTLRPAETADYIVTASSPPCLPVSDTVRITVGDSLYLNPHSLSSLNRNQFYEQRLSTNAETPQFSIVSGKLPEGLSLHTDGLISGFLSSEQPVARNYNLTIQALDCYDCAITRNYLLKNDFYIPLVFSPNGDNINDYFMRGYKVVIFDRLGVKIFEGNNGWDGTSNGKSAAVDTYYYILFEYDENEQELITTGSITLLR